MQETLNLKKMRLAIVAAAMAAIVAFSMGIGAQVAQAEPAIPYGDKASVTIDKVKYTFKNGNKADGVALVGVKAPSSVKTIKVPAYVKLTDKKTGNYHTYKVKIINTKAFQGTTAKTISLPSTVTTIKKCAFAKSKATKLVVQKKISKSLAKKGWLKSSKITKVYAKNKTKLVKKSYSGKANVKAYKK